MELNSSQLRGRGQQKQPAETGQKHFVRANPTVNERLLKKNGKIFLLELNYYN